MILYIYSKNTNFLNGIAFVLLIVSFLNLCGLFMNSLFFYIDLLYKFMLITYLYSMKNNFLSPRITLCNIIHLTLSINIDLRNYLIFASILIIFPSPQHTAKDNLHNRRNFGFHCYITIV